MDRKEQVLDAAEKMIGDGEKPSVRRISEELSWAEEDVHRCLNLLEKNGEVETYPRQVFGKRMRMVSLFR
jgi:predicted transcriptional regulator